MLEGQFEILLSLIVDLWSLVLSQKTSKALQCHRITCSLIYLCTKSRISCLATPSSSHALANFTLIVSAFFLNSCPFSLRHKSIVCRISIPTASRVPFGVSPFLWMRCRPSPVLTWNSSKATWRFSVACAAAAGWSEQKGQQILWKGKH